VLNRRKRGRALVLAVLCLSLLAGPIKTTDAQDAVSQGNWTASVAHCRDSGAGETTPFDVVAVTISANADEVCVKDLWVVAIDSTSKLVSNSYDLSADRCVPSGQSRSGGVLVEPFRPLPAAYCVVLQGQNSETRMQMALHAFAHPDLESSTASQVLCIPATVPRYCPRMKGGFID
jgi:hypothetical protein